MNKTSIILGLFSIVGVGIVGAVLVIVYSPESITAFLNFIGTITAFALTAAVTLSSLQKTNEKLDKVARNTNGTNNALLEAALSSTPLTAERIEQLKNGAAPNV